MTYTEQSPIELQKAIGQLRRNEGSHPDHGHLKNKVKVFQNIRLENTYLDLLEKEDTRPAGRFFLDQLYCTSDVSARDHQVERVLPKLEKYLPAPAVGVVRDVIYMDYLAELMDDLLTQEIRKISDSYDVKVEDELYIHAFREMGEFERREVQIRLVKHVGESMVKLMRFPLLRPILKMTRGAAQKSNLEDFHNFLTEGLSAFSTLHQPKGFFATIEARELALLSDIASGKRLRFS